MVKIFITIDTEEDEWGRFTNTTGTVENINQLYMLQNLFNKYGAIPTYLINYPVASTRSSIKVLSSFLNEGVCEVGMHCHPWNSPPFKEELNSQNSMMCNLPNDLLHEKMSNVHEAIKSNFGISPVSFRAGRWGFSENVARCLIDLEYKVDSSISPFMDWTPYHGKNFRHASTHPYYFNSENIFTPKSDAQLLEVPPTVGYAQPNFPLCDYIQNNLRKTPLSKLRLLGILNRLKLLNFHWLSPEFSTGEEMVRLTKRFVKSGHKFINMSFHSTSLLPGKSPFVRNEADLNLFLAKIEVFLKYAVENDFEFLPLAESMKHM